MFPPLQFNLYFTAVINVAYTRFKACKYIMDALVHLRKETRTQGRGGATAGELAMATLHWGMLYADNAGVVSQSGEQLRKVLRLIVVVGAAFGLTASEMPVTTAIFNVEADGQVYNQTNEFVHLGGEVNHNADLFVEVDRRRRNAWCRLRNCTLELYDQPSAVVELKIRMLRAEVLGTMMLATSCRVHARMTTTRCADSTTAS